MSRTDKDMPYRVKFADRVVWELESGRKLYDLHRGLPIGGDSGFRKTRRWYKRNRSKAIRRYCPEAYSNGAKAPYGGLKRTWDFE